MLRAHPRKLWPRALFLPLAAVPVVVLVLIAYTLARESMPAVSELGLRHLFSSQYSGRYAAGLGLYGLLPPLWGTMLATILATAVALPTSFSLAMLVTEFPLGRISGLVAGLLGALSGIPPIVYALMGIVLVRALIGPKLCGEGLSQDVASALPGLPPWSAGMLPKSMPNSTLLAGMLLGLLAIPFMTPLIEDAIRSVPDSLREASWALGANRWHTLRRVVIPVALPGILGAIILGMLKSAGEVVIVTFVVGYEGNLPTPLWDALERVPLLTATGAGLQGGLGGGAEGRSVVDSSVASFTGLLLLAMAVGVLALASFMERLMRKRLAV